MIEAQPRFFSMVSTAARTASALKLGPLVPPRRMTWTSELPRVLTIAARPCSVTPMKAWGFEAECIASMATPTLPSVPFLKPIGKETPEASSRWSWDSVVRAPIAPQEITEGRSVGWNQTREGKPTVSNELRRNGVKKFRANRDAEVSKVAEELASSAETLVDLEAAIDIGIVDESLPANSGTGLFTEEDVRALIPKEEINVQVSTHDDLKIWEFGNLRLQELGILDRLFGRVD